MRLASGMASLLAATTTTPATTTSTNPNGLTPEQQNLLFPHHTMVGQWLASFRDFASAWLPVFFIVVLGFTAYLLWRLMGSMPRTKPQNMATQGSSTTTWDDVAGVD